MLAFVGSQHILSISLHCHPLYPPLRLMWTSSTTFSSIKLQILLDLLYNITVCCLKLVLIVVMEPWTPKDSSSLLRMKRLALQLCVFPHDRSIELSIYLYICLSSLFASEGTWTFVHVKWMSPESTRRIRYPFVITSMYVVHVAHGSNPRALAWIPWEIPRLTHLTSEHW
jgi:hypothetical protein